jgi:hypothetical protein
MSSVQTKGFPMTHLKRGNATMKILALTMCSASAVVFSGALIAGPLTTPNKFASGNTVSSSQMNQNFTAVKSAVDDNDTRISTNASNITTLQTNVAKLQTGSNCQGQDANDVMVQVGPLCVDKYEASVWDSADGTGTQFGIGDSTPGDNYLCSDNGNDCTTGTANPIYARSQAGVEPSRYITWFQAQQACANVGKRLLTNAEWQMAAAGTPDDGTCNGGTIANTDANPGCVSTYKAVNMAGNVWEWVADWIQGAGINGSNNNTSLYGSDRMISTNPATGQGGGTQFPAAILRGGGVDGTDIGIFAFAAYHAPSDAQGGFGFRCAR